MIEGAAKALLGPNPVAQIYYSINRRRLRLFGSLTGVRPVGSNSGLSLNTYSEKSEFRLGETAARSVPRPLRRWSSKPAQTRPNKVPRNMHGLKRWVLSEISDASGMTRSILIGTSLYLLTSIIVFVGLDFGARVLKQWDSPGITFDYKGEYYANWDGQWYKNIAQEGYFYDPRHHSSVAFFPAYPILVWFVSWCTGIGVVKSLVVVSNACLLATFIGLYRYAVLRYGETPRGEAELSVLALGLVPTGFFFRVAYSESLFLLVTLLFLWSIESKKKPILVALIAGLATSVRPPGIGLLPALVLYLWRQSQGLKTFLFRLGLLIPLGCWGLAEYITFQYLEFGEPLAFAKTQTNWAMRPSIPWPQKAVALATLEPTRGLLDPSSPAYWATYDADVVPFLSLHIADPFYYLATMGLVVLGAVKRWLTVYECITCLSFLIIPYLAHGYESYNRSFGRFASVALPVYLVAGQLLYRAPKPLVCVFGAVAGFLLGAYAAMFSSWHPYM